MVMFFCTFFDAVRHSFVGEAVSLFLRVINEPADVFTCMSGDCRGVNEPWYAMS